MKQFESNQNVLAGKDAKRIIKVRLRSSRGGPNKLPSHSGPYLRGGFSHLLVLLEAYSFWLEIAEKSIERS